MTPTQILSASGGSSLKLHSTYDADFPPVQTLKGAHKLGCHHAVTSKDGKRAASVGFGGEVRLWTCSPRPPGDGGAQNDASRMQAAEGSVKRGEEQWRDDGSVVGVHLSFLAPFVLSPESCGSSEATSGPCMPSSRSSHRLTHGPGHADGNKAGEVWALALSEDGQYLASTTYDGRINVWDTASRGEKIRQYDTKGSFGMCIDLVGSLNPMRYGPGEGWVGVWRRTRCADVCPLLLYDSPLMEDSRLPATRTAGSTSSTTTLGGCCIRCSVSTHRATLNLPCYIKRLCFLESTSSTLLLRTACRSHPRAPFHSHGQRRSITLHSFRSHQTRPHRGLFARQQASGRGG